MRTIAIILARGGSKRIPRKNIIDFCDKPMLAWTIQAALDSACFDRVLVSTDDPEIAAIGRQYGAAVPFLRETAADDNAASGHATLAALVQAENHWQEEYENVAQLMANCPLRSAEDIRQSMAHFHQSNIDGQISCFEFGWMNPWWALKLDNEHRPEYLFPDALKSRSQDLPKLYCPTGALWLAKTKAFKAAATFYLPNHVMHPMHWISAMDIDDNDDLQMAQYFAEKRKHDG